MKERFKKQFKTLKDDELIRNNDAFTVITTNKDGIKFQNEKLERYNSQFIDIKERYEQAQKEVVEDIVKLSSRICFFTLFF